MALFVLMQEGSQETARTFMAPIVSPIFDGATEGRFMCSTRDDEHETASVREHNGAGTFRINDVTRMYRNLPNSIRIQELVLASRLASIASNGDYPHLLPSRHPLYHPTSGTTSNPYGGSRCEF